MLMTLEQKPESEVKMPAVKPIGRLAEILDQFEAPELMARRIARRAGSLMGPNGIKQEAVEQLIIDSLQDGLPNWDRVYGKLAEAANRFYKGKSPFKP